MHISTLVKLMILAKLSSEVDHWGSIKHLILTLYSIANLVLQGCS